MPAGISQDGGSHLHVARDVLGAGQILVDLHDILDLHIRLAQNSRDVVPGQLRLASDAAN